MRIERASRSQRRGEQVSPAAAAWRRSTRAAQLRALYCKAQGAATVPARAESAHCICRERCVAFGCAFSCSRVVLGSGMATNLQPASRSRANDATRLFLSRRDLSTTSSTGPVWTTCASANTLDLTASATRPSQPSPSSTHPNFPPPPPLFPYRTTQRPLIQRATHGASSSFLNLTPSHGEYATAELMSSAYNINQQPCSNSGSSNGRDSSLSNGASTKMSDPRYTDSHIYSHIYEPTGNGGCCCAACDRLTGPAGGGGPAGHTLQRSLYDAAPLHQQFCSQHTTFPYQVIDLWPTLTFFRDLISTVCAFRRRFAPQTS